MAEKRVSVRLAAIGGKQVRAELEGVGAAGARGFGRMSREAELANAKLAAFATRVKIAAGVAVAAAVSAGVAMVKSGLETIDAQANLAQSLGTTTRSIQVLAFAGDLAGVAMEEIAAASKKLTLKLSEAAGGTGTAVDALRRLHLSATDLQSLPLDERIAAIQEAMAKFVAPTERAAVASDLFGDKAALAFSRIDSATLRQASQDITDFGVAVSDQDADQIRTAGDAIDRLGLVWLGLTNQLTVAVAPALETVANALADATRKGGLFQISIAFLGDHIGEIASIAGVLAAFFASRFVIALGAAALGVSGFSLSLTLLKGALIRTGLGALIVGAGELVYQFARLAEGAGGFGAALGLLSDLAKDVWSRMVLAVDVALARMVAGWEGMKAAVLSALDRSIAAVVFFGDRAVAIFQGAYDAAVAIWVSLPGAIGEFAFQAANGLISGVEAMLAAVVQRINAFISSLNAALAILPDWATGEGGVQVGTLDLPVLGRIDNPFAGAASSAGRAAAEAFSTALAGTYVPTPDLGLGAMAEDARMAAGGYREAAAMLAEAAGRPLASWQALKAAMTGAGRDGVQAVADAAAAASSLAAGYDEADEAARHAGSTAAVASERAAAGWARVTQSLTDYAKGAMDWGTGLGETLVSAFTSAEQAFGTFVTTGKFDFKGLISSILADLATLAFKNTVLGPLANWLTGGLGSIFAPVKHAGGIVGAPGPGRMVPAGVFAHAPRLHAGGWAGLRPDEVPAILQRGERVLSRAEVAAGMRRGGGAAGGVTISIDARGAQAGVAEQIDVKLRAAIPEIARLAKASVADGRRRGHSL